MGLKLESEKNSKVNFAEHIIRVILITGIIVQIMIIPNLLITGQIINNDNIIDACFLFSSIIFLTLVCEKIFYDNLIIDISISNFFIHYKKRISFYLSIISLVSYFINVNIVFLYFHNQNIYNCNFLYIIYLILSYIFSFSIVAINKIESGKFSIFLFKR